jgi:tRNA (guanine37-N1)-methyltransferase
MIIDIVTIFPEFFDAFLKTSIIKRAIDSKLIDIRLHQLRDYSHNKHKKIDDTPYGGGVGMLMQFPPFFDVIKQLRTEETFVIMLSPQGKLFNQQEAIQLSTKKHIMLLCGHYEGIDARVEQLIDMELSIGDYVLTGGEIPAMIVADTVSRLIPGVIHEESAGEDSLQNGWLKYPQYTKPETYQGFSVPEVLISGNHQRIETWRKESSVIRTIQKRPDLIQNIKLTEQEIKLMKKMGFTSKE